MLNESSLDVTETFEIFLNKVAKEQESLKNLLSELNILKQEEAKKAEAAMAVAEEEKRKKLQEKQLQ